MAEPRLGGDVAPTFEAVRLRLDPARAEYSGRTGARDFSTPLPGPRKPWPLSPLGRFHLRVRGNSWDAPEPASARLLPVVLAKLCHVPSERSGRPAWHGPSS